MSTLTPTPTPTPTPTLQSSTYIDANLDELAGEMPLFEQQRIQNLRCPPPLSPVYANAKIVAINEQMATQKSALASLEAQISALEQIYKINFAINQVNYYTRTAINQPPQIIIANNSTPQNVQLTFNLNPPLQGPPGVAGLKGRIGPSGVSGNLGIQGSVGYWGQKGKP